MSNTLYFDGVKFVHQLEESDQEVYLVKGFDQYGVDELARVAQTLNNSNIKDKIRQTYYSRECKE